MPSSVGCIFIHIVYLKPNELHVILGRPWLHVPTTLTTTCSAASSSFVPRGLSWQGVPCGVEFPGATQRHHKLEAGQDLDIPLDVFLKNKI